MSIQNLPAFYGFTTMPFGKSLAPSMLHRHHGHNEAVARISWCITGRSLGVITGEVGAGKTVAVRAALAGLDQSRHTIVYLGNPSTGTRGIYGGIVTALGEGSGALVAWPIVDAACALVAGMATFRSADVPERQR